MRNDKLIPGLILVMIGAAFLLDNFGLINFHWENIWHLWPIFLVIAGINLVFAHNKTPWATILKISVVLLGFGIILFGNFSNRTGFWAKHGIFINSNSDFSDSDDNDSNNSSDDKSDGKMSGKGAFSEPYQADMKIARLNINGGGTTYRLSDSTNQLFSAITRNGGYKYSVTQRKEGDSVYVVSFNTNNHHGFNFDSDKNRADIKLNINPIWDVNISTGATDLNFDLSKFKVRNVKLHGGAANFNVKLGEPLAMTNVDVSAGMADVTVSVPEHAACSIEINSGLSDNNFEGFNKISDNQYETPGYDAAKNKVHIHIKGGLSDFKVKRY